MIWILVRNHVKRPPGFIVSVIATLAIIATPRVGIVAIAPLFPLIWRFTNERTSYFEAALPISGRELYLSRLIASLMFVWLPLVAWTVVSFATDQVGQSLLGQSLYARFNAIAVATLAALIPHVVRPDTIGPAPTRILAPVCAVLATGCALVIYYLDPADSLTLIAVVCVVVFAYTLARIPRGFVSAPNNQARTRARAITSRAASTSCGSRAGWWRVMLTSNFAPYYILIFVIVSVASSVGSSLIYLFIFTATVVEYGRQRTRWLYALPFSSRRLLLITIAPTALVVLGGFATGRLVLMPLRARIDFLSHGAPESSLPAKAYFSNRTGVPLEYWQRADGSTPPPIVAPWGEKIEPDTMTVLGVHFFNPFTAGEESSNRFAEWQLERATTTVYGRPMNIAEYDEARAARPRRATETPRMLILNAGAIVVVFLLLLLLSEIGRWHVITRMRRGTLTATWLASLPAFAILGVDFFVGGKRGTDIVVPMAERFFFSVNHLLPDNVAVVIVVALVPIVVTFKLLEWQFAKSESSSKLKERTR